VSCIANEATKIGWYNEQVIHEAFHLPHPYDSLALVVISTPGCSTMDSSHSSKKLLALEGETQLMHEFMAYISEKVKY